MRKPLLIFTVCCIIVSCRKHPKTPVDFNTVLAQHSLRYVGTPYKYGGITPEGMDCSGLVFRTFLDFDKKLPRSSHEQARVFDEVPRRDLRVGDLLYFKVANSSRIDHTGIVTRIVNSETVYFAHSSSSVGVREDNLYSKYWKPKFVKATRPKF